MKTYPYIGKSEHGNIYLFTSSNAAYSFINKTWMPDASQLIPMINITHEYLQNTYGEVVSPEHAEFIILLAVSHGIAILNAPWKDVTHFTIENGQIFFVACAGIDSTKLKQITIPLPPKAKPKIYPKENLGEAPKHFDCVCNKCGGKCCTGQCDEWLCVGSIVTWGNKSVKGEVKALSDGLAWIKNEYGNYCSEYVSSLQKPKTPEEELLDNAMERAKSMGLSAKDVEKSLLSVFKKKPQ